VTVGLSGPIRRASILRCPHGNPGSYMIREFAAIVRLTALAGGRKLRVESWTSTPGVGARTEEDVTLAYEVYAFDLSVAPPTGPGTGLFQRAALLLGRLDASSRLPAGHLPPAGVRAGSWQLLTGLQARGAPGRRVRSLPGA